MLTIYVCENGERRLERHVPEEYREVGCVVLLQETFVATLMPGGAAECGPFQVSMIDEGAVEWSSAIEAGRSESGDDAASGGFASDERAEEGKSDLLSQSDPITVYEESLSGDPIALEVHARIPGYDFQALLGRGGMGLVWKAVQLSTNRLVAVKTIHPRMLGNPKSQKRFQREVEVAARLTHPNIARVYEAGEVAGQNYFSMELVEGVPWNQYVRSRRPGKTEVLRQLLQVLDAVAYAHGQGVVHRDLKPSNILVDGSGRVYVVDFGLAKHHGDREPLSEHGDIIGTLTFMSPEQASGEVSSTDSRSDVYSLGAVVLYLLSNGMSIDKLGGREECRRILIEGALQKHAAGILRNDPRLRRILLKALAPSPDQRYQEAGAFASDLRDYLEDRLTEVYRSKVKRQSRAARWVFLAVGAVITVGAIGGFVLWRNKNNTPPGNAVVSQRDAVAQANLGRNRRSAREAVIAEKFGERFETSFQSAGVYTGRGTASSGVGTANPTNYFIAHPRGWPLVGFNLTTYDYLGDQIIKTLQPIFRDPEDGDTATSEMVGRLHPNCVFHQVVAEPGYAVSGLRGIGSNRLYGLRVIFRRLESAPASSKQGESYESPWFGQVGDESAETAGGTEAVARGIVCSFSADMHQVRLILDEVPSGG